MKSQNINTKIQTNKKMKKTDEIAKNQKQKIKIGQDS
jgi:hypothetical protein